MKDRIIDVSPRLEARVAGGLYLIIIAGGMFAEVFVREALTVPGDAAATASKILASQPLYRLGFTADLFNLVCGIPLALIFYDLFKPVSKNLALLALFFTLVSTAINSALNILALAPLILLHSAHYSTAFEPGQLQAVSLMSLELHAQGFDISLAFFGFQCLTTGYLIFRSTFLPRILGVLYALAGLCYGINSFTVFLAPEFATHLLPYILIPCFIGEASLCLWLLAMGVNVPRWEEQASAAA